MASPAPEQRLWRPAAQRSVRNTWSSISGASSTWCSASAAGLSAAKALVNAFLTQRYTPDMNMGVLNDVKARAQKKLYDQQLMYLDTLIDAYRKLEEATSQMIREAKSMRVFVKQTGDMVAFSKEKHFEDDPGDGNGAPVFSMLTVKCFEHLADELARMYLKELRMKWLITSELISLVGEQFDKLSTDRLRELENSLLGHQNLCPQNEKVLATEPLPKQRKTLEIYLTFWLAEVNVRKHRVDEVLMLVNEEMKV